MAGEKAVHGVMIGVIAKFPLEDPDHFAVMDGRIELFHIQHVGGHGLGIHMALPARLPHALIHQPEHPLHDKAAGFVAHAGPLDPGLAAAFGNGFREQDNGANDFVIVLNVVDELELVLRKVLRSRHAHSPSHGVGRRTTGYATAGRRPPPKGS